MYQVKNPILFLIFKRPNQTEKVFDAIRKIKPKQLYIASDGPRKNKSEEAELNKKCKEIVANVDWPCDIKTLFREENLGSPKAIPESVTWFFSQEEQGIVLEDDCLPNESFFIFCDELLEKHKNNEKIFWINGSNLNSDVFTHMESSYEYSYYPISWGWASWRRAWERFDSEMLDWRIKRKSKFLKSFSNNSMLTESYWKAAFDYAYTIPNWDIRFIYSCWKNNALACTPKNNLISNIGFGDGSTHVTSEQDPLSNIPTKSIVLPIIHPYLEQRSIFLDNYFNKNLYKIAPTRILRLLVFSKFPSLRTILRKIFHN